MASCSQRNKVGTLRGYRLGRVNPGAAVAFVCHGYYADYSRTFHAGPGRYSAHRYYLSSHGVGMTSEYPYLYHTQGFAEFGYAGVIEPQMTLCVESLIGADNGEGVKLEQQILVTDHGIELLSMYPFDAGLLG